MYRHPPVFALSDYIAEFVDQNLGTVRHDELMELVTDILRTATARVSDAYIISLADYIVKFSIH